MEEQLVDAAMQISEQRKRIQALEEETQLANRLLARLEVEKIVTSARRGVEAKSLLPPPRESGALPAVTRIARAEGSDLVAAGHSDGTIRLWSLDDASTDVLLKGHRSEVTALRFNASGSMLVSGGKDTNVVVWDVVAETGLCRLRGHKDQVTDAVFAEADATAAAGRLVQLGRAYAGLGRLAECLAVVHPVAAAPHQRQPVPTPCRSLTHWVVLKKVVEQILKVLVEVHGQTAEQQPVEHEKVDIRSLRIGPELEERFEDTSRGF